MTDLANVPCSADVLSELIKLADLCLIFGSALGGYYAYIAIHGKPLAGGMGRYIVPICFGAVLFIYLITQVQSYELRRLNLSLSIVEHNFKDSRFF